MSKDETDWRPAWDQNAAEAALGKTVLIGITRLAPDGVTVRRQEQYFGVVVAVDQKNGVTIERRGAHAGELMTLPPDLSLFKSAPPGEYRLRSTGEVVTDPDFLSEWTLSEPVKH